MFKHLKTMRRGLLTGRVVLFCLGLMAALLIAGEGSSAVAPPSVKESLLVAGSGTNLSITRLLANAFMRIHPEISIEIPESIGSGAAIQAVNDGAISIGLVSRPLEGIEKTYGLTLLDYARTALVIGVNPTVPDDGLTYEDLRNIYRGTKNRWNNGKEIVVLTREPGESSIEILKKEIPGFAELYDASQNTGRWATIHKDQAMNQALAKTSDAIGLSDLGTMTIERLAIKPLRINGVAPSLQNMQNGKYRPIKTLSLVFRKERLPPPARLFIEFVKSESAGKIMKVNGYVPGK